MSRASPNASARTNSQTTLTGRINIASDVDVYRLDGAETGGLISISATGAQGGNATLRIFDQAGVQLTSAFVNLGPFVLPAATTYYLGYSA